MLLFIDSLQRHNCQGKEEVLLEVLGMEMIIKAATNDFDSRPVATVLSTYLDSTWRPTWMANIT